MRKAANLFTKIISILFVGIFTGCLNRPEPPLRVGTNYWPGYECLYLARGLGYYDGTPIKLIQYPSASEVMRAFRNGNIEVAALTIDEVLLLAEQNHDPHIFLITDFSSGGDGIMARPEIKDIQGLKGRRVGVESSALGAFMISRALDQAGMSLKDIEVVSIEVSEHEKAFKEGRVDAVVTFEPVRTRLLSLGANNIFDSSKIPGEVVDVLAIRKDILRSRRSSLDILLNGWFRALSYLNRFPLDAARMIAPREDIMPKHFLDALKGLHLLNQRENQILLSRSGTSLRNGVKRLSQVMVEKGLLKKEIDVNLMLTDEVVKEVK